MSGSESQFHQCQEKDNQPQLPLEPPTPTPEAMDPKT